MTKELAKLSDTYLEPSQKSFFCKNIERFSQKKNDHHLIKSKLLHVTCTLF